MKDLFSEFATVTFQEWKEKIIKDLKGGDFENLFHKDENGLVVAPFYNEQNSVNPILFAKDNPDWLLTQHLSVNGERATNKVALQTLNAGANALVFDLGNQQNCDFETLLNGVAMPYIHTVFRVTYPAARLVYSFKDYLQNGYPSENPKNCFFHYDPIADYFQFPEDYSKPEAGDYLDFYKSAKAYFRLSVDGALYQNAGANSVLQLALALAHLNEYLHFLQAEATEEKPLRVIVNMATGTGFFEEIAKLRALKLLLPLLLETYGRQVIVEVSVETSNLYRSPVDAYTNLLRDTVAGMAAVVADCDYLVIHAFDQEVAEKKTSGFGAHLARNQQLIFKEESYLNKVADMGSGSFFIEKRTEEIAEAAWKMFQEIEHRNGLLAAFKEGWVQEIIKKQATQLIEQYQVGKKILIGVNKYANLEGPKNEIHGTEPRVKEQGIRPVNLVKAILQGRGK